VHNLAFRRITTLTKRKEAKEVFLGFTPVFAHGLLSVSSPVTDAFSPWQASLSVQKQLTEPLSDQQSKAKLSCSRCIVPATVARREATSLPATFRHGVGVPSPAPTPSRAFTFTRSPLRRSGFSFALQGSRQPSTAEPTGKESSENPGDELTCPVSLIDFSRFIAKIAVSFPTRKICNMLFRFSDSLILLVLTLIIQYIKDL